MAPPKKIPSGSTLLARRIRTSFQIALERHDKVATGSTLRSIEVRKVAKPTFYGFEVWAGPGFRFTQWGKRANTKLPVYKQGGRFYLVPELAAWKKAVGATMPDFLLARSIARKARAPVDLIGEAEKDIKTYLEKSIIEDLGFEEYFLRQFNALASRG